MNKLKPNHAADPYAGMVRINTNLKDFMPEWAAEYDLMPNQITIGDGVSVKHGVVNGNFQEAQGSIYGILSTHGDVGIWNELYTEDREDGVHLVYRPIPAFLLSRPDDRGSAKIQEDAPTPPIGRIEDYSIKSIQESRSDANLANFFRVNNSRFDLVDDMVRRLFALQEGSNFLTDYPNASPKYYGVRPMYADSQQGEDSITNMSGGQPQAQHEERGNKQLSWQQDRLRIMMEMKKDNVIYESGTAIVKGGPLRQDKENDLLKAGDYVLFVNGDVQYSAYVHQIDHDFQPFRSYTTTLHFDRGEGFAMRAAMTGSPWLSEQSSGSGKS